MRSHRTSCNSVCMCIFSSLARFAAKSFFINLLRAPWHIGYEVTNKLREKAIYLPLPLFRILMHIHIPNGANHLEWCAAKNE